MPYTYWTTQDIEIIREMNYINGFEYGYKLAYLDQQDRIEELEKRIERKDNLHDHLDKEYKDMFDKWIERGDHISELNDKNLNKFGFIIISSIFYVISTTFLIALL